MLFTTLKMKGINKRKIPVIILLMNIVFRENKNHTLFYHMLLVHNDMPTEKASERVNSNRLKNLFFNLLIRSNNSFYKGGTETIMLHLV
jgi:hypothetical protein